MHRSGYLLAVEVSGASLSWQRRIGPRDRLQAQRRRGDDWRSLHHLRSELSETWRFPDGLDVRLIALIVLVIWTVPFWLRDHDVALTSR